MKQNRLNLLSTFLFMMLLFYSCNEETTKVDLPTSAIIHYSEVDKQVAFTALTHNADTYLWDFGDGETSTDKDPVHVYETGYYTAILTVTGGTGTDADTVDLTIGAPPYGLLTGGPNAKNGKTWKLTPNHSKSDKLANADADFTLADGVPPELPPGVFGSLGMSEVYEDEFTFFFDGSYSHDVKEDEASFGGIVYQIATTAGAGIVNANGQDFGLCTGKYTPETGATFTFVESEDLEVSSVYGPGGKLTYSNVATLDFSGAEFIGFMDFQRKVIVEELTANSMRLVMFMAAGQDPSIIGINTHALILTFEVAS